MAVCYATSLQVLEGIGQNRPYMGNLLIIQTTHLRFTSTNTNSPVLAPEVLNAGYTSNISLDKIK